MVSNCHSHFGLPPNGLAFSCRERAAQDHVQKATISRAKRSAAMPGWAAGSKEVLRLLCDHSLEQSQQGRRQLYFGHHAIAPKGYATTQPHCIGGTASLICTRRRGAPLLVRSVECLPFFRSERNSLSPS